MRHAMDGASLLELLIAITVFAVGIAIAVPGYRTLSESVRSASLNAELIAALNTTRQSAVFGRTPVSICVSETGVSCTEESGWHTGWIIFEDPKRLGRCVDSLDDGRCDTGGGRILQVNTRSVAGLTIVANHNVRHRVRFNSSGMSPGSNGRLTICAQNEARPLRGIVLSNPGRVRVAAARELLECPPDMPG